MPKDPRTLDQAILAEQDYGWVADPTLRLSDEDRERLVDCFGEMSAEHGDRLRAALDRLFRSFVTTASFERRADRKHGVGKPSTVAIRELKDLGAALRSLDGKLARLGPETIAAIDLELEDLGAMDASGRPLTCGNLRTRLYASLELWHYMAQQADVAPARGPSNVALYSLVGSLANCWEVVHGEPPVTDKGRGRRDDPFLDLCKAFAAAARPNIKARGADLGSLNLSGIVAEVVAERRRGRG